MKTESKLKKGLKYCGGLLAGLGLLSSVMSGNDVEAFDPIREDISVERFNYEKYYDGLKDETNNETLIKIPEKRTTNSSESLASNLNLVYDQKTKVSSQYSLLLTDIEINYTIEELVDANKQNEIIRKVNGNLNSEIEGIYRIFLTQVNFSDVPSFITNVFLTQEEINKRTSTMINQMAQSDYNLNLEKENTEKISEINKITYSGDFNVGINYIEDQNKIQTLQDDSIKVNANVYNWFEGDQILNTLVATYPADNPKVETYYPNEDTVTEGYIDIKDEEFISSLEKEIQNLTD